MQISKRTSKPDLIKYAREDLGLNPADEATKEDLFELIAKNGGPDLTATADDSGDTGAAQTEVAGEDASARAARLEKTFVRIKLFDKPNDNSEQITTVDPLTLQHVTIRRNVEVTVNYPIYSGLKNAITKLITQGKDGALIEKEVLTEPFTVIAFDVNPDDYADE